MKKYLIIGDAESVHIVKWVKQLVGFFDVYLIASRSVHEKIRALVPEENLFELRINLKEEGGNYQILKKLWKIKRIIKKIGPDYVNAHYITSYGFLAALIKGLSSSGFILIQSAWGSDILVTPFKNKPYGFITKFALNRAHLVTSDSQYMSGVIAKLTSTEIMTFTFGLDRLPVIESDEKDEHLFYSNRILSDNYKIDEVIKAFHRIVQNNPQARLIISNDGNKRVGLENLVKELNISRKVSFRGFISLDEQVSIYNKAGFYFSLPESDSTSVSLLEAMAHGCIPIVSNIPANLEWIRDGQNGILFTDSESLIKSINKIKNQQEQIMEANRRLIEEKAIFPLSIKKYITRIENLKK